MPTKSYKGFRDGIRRSIWPAVPGEPNNLVDAHNIAFLEAMATAGKWVPCLQQHNVTVWPFCSTYVECGKTVVKAPIGVISKVYTIANNVWCDPVEYASWTWRQLECWVNDMITIFTAPGNSGYPVLKLGRKYAESSTDITGGRARIGAWAIHNDWLYIAPWIQSNESIVVEWDGVKKIWNDDDLVDTDLWDKDVEEFVKFFVRWKHEDQFGCDREKKLDLRAEQAAKLADIIHDCKRRIRAREEEACMNPKRSPSYSELSDDEDAEAAEADVVIANIGDYADPDNGTAEADVAAIVAAWNPSFIITNGSNHFGSPAAYATKVGAYYGDYIGSTVLEQKFFPALGYKDEDDAGLAEYQEYFALPGNERFYDFVSGNIHVFVLHSGIPGGGDGSTSTEPEGHTSTSNQAEWLKQKLLLSTARWKIVVLHDPPYTSESNDYPGFTQLRWDFRTWGADLVLSARGHLYERQKVNNLTYIINGAGGAALGSFTGSPDATSQYRYNAKNGAVKLTVSEDSLVSEFINVDGDVIDSVTLEK